MAVSAGHVAAVRAFNRFYTRRIGALGERLLDSPFSLSEMRVLYELAHRRGATATELAADLGLDAGYLSRMLNRFRERGFLQREASAADARRQLIRLTTRGRKAFAPYESRARREVSVMLGQLPGAGQRRVVGAMQTIERALAGGTAPPVRLRTHRPGDMGWVVHRHGAIYAGEWGYDHEFEALVARIVADFLDHFDPTGERCWIAEQDGEIVGSVFLVRKSKTIAKLRLLLVEPQARGLGVGGRLIDACIRFARQAGYRTITLWTQSELTAARRLYERAGFRRVNHVKHRSFGKALVAETWDLTL
jgi:DNA-binding MarR family transcriptional regulator/N-acetylglutamate synthase-like GNAT family acetyltransferase